MNSCAACKPSLLRAHLQVVAILASGAQLPFEVTSVNLDLPELQGEPEEISKEKCRIAAKEVPPIITGISSIRTLTLPIV